MKQIGLKETAHSACDDDARIRAILGLCGELARQVGPIDLSRLLIAAGLRLMMQARGKAEGYGLLRRMVVKASKQAHHAQGVR